MILTDWWKAAYIFCVTGFAIAYFSVTTPARVNHYKRTLTFIERALTNYEPPRPENQCRPPQYSPLAYKMMKLPKKNIRACSKNAWL